MTKFCTSRVLFQVKFWIKLATQRHNSTETWLGQGWRLDVLVGHDSAARPADMAGAGIISGMSQLIALAVYLGMITYLRATYRGYQWCSRATEHVIRSQLNWTRSLAQTDIHRGIKKNVRLKTCSTPFCMSNFQVNKATTVGADQVSVSGAAIAIGYHYQQHNKIKGDRNYRSLFVIFQVDRGSQ